MSIHSKDDYAKQLIDYVLNNLNSGLTAGGHSHRAGGSIESTDPTVCKSFVNYFLTAAKFVG